MVDKLIIGELDPTSSCGNCCRHCGDSSKPNGLDMPLADVEALLRSGLFKISDATHKFTLAGGGDPTAYKPGLIELLRILSSFTRSILVLTGGVQQLTLPQLREIAAFSSGPTTKVDFIINHHPFGSNGHEARIKKTLLMFRDSGLLGWQLRVRCISEEVVAQCDPTTRRMFPYTTRATFERSELWRWLEKKFNIILMTSPHEMLRCARTQVSRLPPLIIDYTEDPLRCSGRATALPTVLASGCTVLKNVEVLLSIIQDLEQYPLRVTYDGYVTGCESSRFPRTDFFEGDLYGHSYDEIAANRRLFLEHFASEGRRWRESRTSEPGNICDTVCRRARENFVNDPKRFPSHRGQGETILKARAIVR